LRWPSLMRVLDAIASRNGCSVQPSVPGRRARIVSELWGSLPELMSDLVGTPRMLLNVFVDVPDIVNGPFAHGIIRQGVAYSSFDRLASLAVAAGWTHNDLREWLDRKMTGGAVRRGLL